MTDKKDTSNKDWVQPNGCTFLAITQGTYGGWAKSTDRITAIAKAKNNSDSYSEFEYVEVWYGKDEHIKCGTLGGLAFTIGEKPVPIGMYRVSKRGKVEELTESIILQDGIIQSEHVKYYVYENWIKDNL